MRKATLITGSILIAVTIAWLVIRQNYKNIVLMDIQMPVMNGLDATRYIRNELKSAVPVIALTANAIRGENEKCFAAGMNDYLSKPFEESQLIEIISKWIGIKPAIKIKEDAAEVNNKANPMYNLSKL